MIYDITHALASLKPNAQWSLNGNSYEGLVWADTVQSKPSEQQLLAEVTRLQNEYDALEYQRSRAKEYPPVTDYLDGVVKGNQTQIDTYVAACLAVKAKYPKP